ncbi:MAG: FtsQ-type POTRA domain-containing protein [bacterium]
MRQRIRFQRKKKKFPLKRIFFGGLFFCLLVVLIYFFIFSSFLQIKKIQVGFSDLSVLSDFESEIIKITQDNLEKKLWKFVPQKNILMAPINKIRNDILDRFPEIKEINFNRKIPDVLKIEIQERKSIGIWCGMKYEENEESKEGEENIATTTTEIKEVEGKTPPKKEITDCFYIDNQGIVYKEAPLMSGSLILNIYSFRDDQVNIRDEVVTLEIINSILLIKEKLPEIKLTDGELLRAIDFEVFSIIDLRVNTSFNWQIYFNPFFSIDSQLNALEIVLREEIKEDYHSLEYIDLTSEGRVYYK